MRHLTRHLRPGATRIMVVYSRATGVTRRIIDADHDDEYAQHEALVHPGEGFLYLTIAEYDAHRSPHALHHDVVTRAGFPATIEPNGTVTVHHATRGDYDLTTIDQHDILDPQGNRIGACHCDPTCGDSGEHIAPGHTLAPVHPQP